MAGTNKLYPFADDENANVVTAEQYQEYNQRTTGFQSGIARSEYCNRVFAQGANSGFAIGELIRNYTNRTADIAPTELAQYFEEALEAFGRAVILPAVLSAAFPIGSIYTSTNSANPATYLGVGTWAAYGAGRVLVGAGGAYAAGSTGGAASVRFTPSGTVQGTVLTVANLPSHTHTATAASNGAHTHTAQSAGGHTHSEADAGGHTHAEDNAGAHAHTAQSAGAHTHSRGTMEITGTIAGAGEGAGFCSGAFTTPGRTGAIVNNSGDRDNLYEFTASKSWTGATSSNGGHTHTIESAGSHKHTISSAGTHRHTINSAGAHTHTTDSKGSHSHTITVTATGSGTAHTHAFTGAEITVSTLQPYIVVYFWRRTA